MRKIHFLKTFSKVEEKIQERKLIAKNNTFK